MSTTEYLKFGLIATTLPEGILATGNTFENKDMLKGLGAKWSPEKKGWLMPSATDLSTLRYPPRPRQVYEPNMWAYDRLRDVRRKECCSKCKREFDDFNPQGPMWFVCPVHGKWKSDYTGD